MSPFKPTWIFLNCFYNFFIFYYKILTSLWIKSLKPFEILIFVRPVIHEKFSSSRVFHSIALLKCGEKYLNFRLLQFLIYFSYESLKRSKSFKLSPSIKESRMRLKESLTSKATNPKTSSVNLTSRPFKSYVNFRSHFLAVPLKINIIEFVLSCNNLRENEKNP